MAGFNFKEAYRKKKEEEEKEASSSSSKFDFKKAYAQQKKEERYAAKPTAYKPAAYTPKVQQKRYLTEHEARADGVNVKNEEWYARERAANRLGEYATYQDYLTGEALKQKGGKADLNTAQQTATEFANWQNRSRSLLQKYAEEAVKHETASSNTLDANRRTIAELAEQAAQIKNNLYANREIFGNEQVEKAVQEIDRVLEGGAAVKEATKERDYASAPGWQKYLQDKKANLPSTTDQLVSTYAHTSDSLAGQAMQNAKRTYAEDTSYREPDERWNDLQRKEFGDLYGEDPKQAYEYAIKLNNHLNREEREAKLKPVKEFATKGFDEGAASSMGALLASPTAIVDFLSDVAEFAGRGTITEKSYATAYDRGEAAKSSITEKLNEFGTIDKSVPVVGGKGFGDVYGLSMSIAQSLAIAATGGEGAALQFFGQAAASATDDALSRGGDAGQAVLYGLFSGMAEVAAEQIPLDNLMNMKPAATFKDTLKNIAKQGGTEATEEFATAWANTVSDVLIMQYDSEYAQLAKQYIEQGMSEEEAYRAAYRKVLEGMAYDTLSGFLSGGISGGIGTSAANAAVQQNENDEHAPENAPETAEPLQGEVTPEFELRVAETEKQAQQTAGERIAASAKEADAPKWFEQTGSEAKIRTVGGDIVSASDVRFADDTQRRLFAMANDYAPAQANNFIASYKDGNDLTRYKRAYDAFVRAEQVYDSFDDVLSIGGDVYRAFANDIGMAEAKSAFTVAFNTDQNITVRKTAREEIDANGGLIRNYTVKPKRAAALQMDAMEAIGKTYKIAFEVVDDIGIPVNGFYNPKTKRIVVGMNAVDNALLRTASHEMYHFIEESNAEAAASLRTFVIGELKKNAAYDYEARRSWLLENGYTDGNVDAEITADSMFDVFNEESIKKLAEENPGFFKKVLDFFEELIDEIGDILDRIISKRKYSSMEMKALRDQKETLETIREMFFNALEERKNTDSQKTEDGAKYSLQEYTEKQKENWKSSKRIVIYESEKQFRDFIDKAKKDKTFSKKMYFGAIPRNMAADVLRETGIDIAGYNCSISGNEIRKILKKHGDEKQENLQGQRAITDDDFILIPEILEKAEGIKLSEDTYEGKPAIVFTSKVNGEISVVAVVSDKHLDLFVQTMYARNKKGNLATPTVVQTTVFTPEAPRGTVSTNTITQPEDSVNAYSAMERDANELIAENEKLRKMVETLKAQFKLTKGVKVNRDHVEKLARKLVRENRSRTDVQKVTDQLVDLFDYIGNDPEKNGNIALSYAQKIAQGIIEKSRDGDPIYIEDYEALRKYLRAEAVRIPDEVRRDKAYYQDVRQKLFGRVTMSNNGVSVDKFVDDLKRAFPQFERLENEYGYDPTEVLISVADAAFTRIIPESYEDLDTKAFEMANEIFDAYFDIPQFHSYADKQKAALEAQRRQLRDQYRQLNAALRKDLTEQYEGKISRMREAQRAKERKKLINEERQRLLKNTTTVLRRVAKRFTHPTDKQNIPLAYKVEIGKLLNTLDLSKIKLGDTWDASTKLFHELKAELEKATAEKDSTLTGNQREMFNEMNIDPDMKTNIELANMRLQELFELNDSQPINATDIDLQTLSLINEAMLSVQTAVTNYNKLLTADRVWYVSDLAERTDFDTKSKAKERGQFTQKLRNLFALDMMSVDTYLHEFGEAGDELFGMLRFGLNKQAQRIREAKRFADAEFAKFDKDFRKAINAKETVTYSFGRGDVTFTKQQIMELYALNKRQQARRHIYNGGILTGRMKEAVVPTEFEMQQLFKEHLTAEERKFADSLQGFLSKDVSEWGNEITRKEYGYEKFGEEFYWPIKVDKTTVDATDKSASTTVGMTAARNIGATKTTNEYAVNALRVGNFMDTFSKHVTEMATYNAYALPIRDLMNWYNYRSFDGKVNTKKMIQSVYGDSFDKKKNTQKGKTPGEAYFEKFMQDLNAFGFGSDVEAAKWTSRMISAYKGAAMGANVRVAVQQPTALIRALEYIEPKYFTGKKIKRDGQKISSFEEAALYSGAAQMKAWGFSENGLSTQLSKVITDDQSFVERVRDKAMIMAEKADAVTWGRIWEASKRKALAQDPDSDTNSDAFYEKAVQIFDEAVYNTQVFDSVLTRSQNMRSDNALVKAMTAFTSEPAKNYNLLLRALQDKDGKKLAKRAALFTTSTLLATVVASAISAFRDDDDYKTWFEKWFGAIGKDLAGNLNPFAAVPVVSAISDGIMEALGLSPEYSDTNMATAVVDMCIDLFTTLVTADENTNWQSTANKVIKTVSYGTGNPAYNLLRDLLAVWNTAAGATGAREGKIRLSDYSVTKDGELYDYLFRAMESGDVATQKRVRAELNFREKTAQEIESGLKRVFKDAYRVELGAAATALQEGDTALYEEYLSGLMDDTGLTRANVIDSIESVRAKAYPEDKEEPTEPKSEKSAYSSATINRYLAAGDVTAAQKGVNELYEYKLSEALEKGETQKDAEGAARSAVKTAVSSRWREEYITAYLAKDYSRTDQIKQMLNRLTANGRKLYTNDDYGAWKKAAKAK